LNSGHVLSNQTVFDRGVYLQVVLRLGIEFYRIWISEMHQCFI